MLTLLCAESEPPSLVWPSRSGGTVHAGQLAVLPYPYTQKKTHNIAQFLAVQLLNISVRAHLGQPVADLVTKSTYIDQKSHHRSGHKKSDLGPVTYNMPL